VRAGPGAAASERTSTWLAPDRGEDEALQDYRAAVILHHRRLPDEPPGASTSGQGPRRADALTVVRRMP